MNNKLPRWSRRIPNREGVYLFRCEENGQKPERLMVYRVKHGGMLWVDCPDTGKNPVKVYHESLCKASWKLYIESK